MAMTNAERQRRWRDKRNALAKKAGKWVAMPNEPASVRIKAALEYWEKVESELAEAVKTLAHEYALAADGHADQKAFKIWLIHRGLEHFGGATVDALVTLGREVVIGHKDGESLIPDMLQTIDGKNVGGGIPVALLNEWNRRKEWRRK